MRVSGCAIGSFVAAGCIMVFISRNGGAAGEVRVLDQTFGGSRLYVMAALLALAGLLLLLSAWIEMRRTATSIAIAALLGVVAVSGMTPASIAGYARAHGCVSTVAPDDHRSALDRVCHTPAPQ